MTDGLEISLNIVKNQGKVAFFVFMASVQVIKKPCKNEHVFSFRYRDTRRWTLGKIAGCEPIKKAPEKSEASCGSLSFFQNVRSSLIVFIAIIFITHFIFVKRCLAIIAVHSPRADSA